jgi:hypothetical protein
VTWYLISPWWLGPVIFGVFGAALGCLIYARVQTVGRSALFMLFLSVVVGLGPALRFDRIGRGATSANDPRRQTWKSMGGQDQSSWRMTWFMTSGGIVFAAGMLGIGVTHRVAYRD